MKMFISALELSEAIFHDGKATEPWPTPSEITCECKIHMVSSGDFSKYIDENRKLKKLELCRDLLEGTLQIVGVNTPNVK